MTEKKQKFFKTNLGFFCLGLGVFAAAGIVGTIPALGSWAVLTSIAVAVVGVGGILWLKNKKEPESNTDE